MRIVLYADFSKEHLPEFSQFFNDIILGIALRRTIDSFIILSHQTGNKMPELPANVSVRILRFKFLYWRMLKWWNKNLIAKELKNLQADLFITVNSLYVNRYGIPCCFFLIELLQEPPEAGSSKSLKNRRSVTVNKANKPLRSALENSTATIVFSNHYSQILKNKFSAPAEKIKLLPMDAVHDTGSFNWVEKENIKIHYAAGQEYFLFAGDIHPGHDLISLLKAFSQFKKWQQSGMQLIIACRNTAYSEEFIQKLASFKYRNDVHLIIDPPKESLHAIIGAAYAFVYPALYDHFPLNLLLAIRAGVPVIAFAAPIIQEIANNAVIYTESNAEALSKSMQSIYKDEEFRGRVIASTEKHHAQKGKFDIVSACWNIFQDMVTK